MVARPGKLGADHLQALRQRIDPLARRKGQDGMQRRLCPVEFSRAQPRHGQLDMSQHAQLEAVVLAFLRPGRIEFRSAFQLGDRVASGVGDLQESRAGQVMLARPGEPELAAQLQEIIVVSQLPGVQGLANRPSGSASVA